MNSHGGVRPFKLTKLAFVCICTLTLIAISTCGAESMKSPNVKSAKSKQECLVYVGTYTGAKSKGIYLCRMNLATGEMFPLGVAAETRNPTFLDIDPKRALLFTVNEVDKHEGKPAGAI